VTDKPALDAPDAPFGHWPIIPHVGQPIMGEVKQLIRVASLAADFWHLGPDGPVRNPMTPAEANRGYLRTALLHLLELGLVDIDHERLAQGDEIGYPMRREVDGPS